MQIQYHMLCTFKISIQCNPTAHNIILYTQVNFILFIYKLFLNIYNKCIIKIYKQRLMNS